MSAGRIRILIVVLIVLQVVVLIGMTALHGARIAAGTEVRLAVEPFDPVDLTRGAYVDLDYGFDDLELPEGAGPGDRAYVELRDVDAGEATEPTGRVELDSNDLPRGAVWIRLPVNVDGEVDMSDIRTWYAETEEALDAERNLVDGRGLAVVSLDDDGDPTLVTLESD